jgi:hypothetical protein
MARSVAKEAEKLTSGDDKRLIEIRDLLKEILEVVQDDDELRPQAQKHCPPPTNPYPELASLGKYLRERNYTSIYSIATNTRFLSNLLWGWVPSDSAAWHPQTLGDWAEAQFGEAYFGVLAALVIHCIDSILAALAARGWKIRPSWTGKVKLKSFTFFSVGLKTLLPKQQNCNK